MTLREKLLYHQVHPVKTSVDVTTALAPAVLLPGALLGSGRIAAEP